jgi:hypothetical protein
MSENPVISSPVISSPVISSPVISSPVISAPVISSPVISAPVISSNPIGRYPITTISLPFFVETRDGEHSSPLCPFRCFPECPYRDPSLDPMRKISVASLYSQWGGETKWWIDK